MPWQPGESGNPDGPRKQKKFLAALERALLADGSEKIRGIADKLVEAALSGEPWAIKEVADRLDGKPVQQIAADPEGGAVAIALVAYHPAQLPAKDVSAPGPERIGFRNQEGGSGMAS